MKLTTNFDREEFRYHNMPLDDVIVDYTLVTGLQEIRNRLNERSAVPRKIIITKGGGWRPYGGEARRSLHCDGKAADIYSPGVSMMELVETALQVPQFFFGGIGLYADEDDPLGHGFIHVDIRLSPARWIRNNSIYIYTWPPSYALLQRAAEANYQEQRDV